MSLADTLLRTWLVEGSRTWGSPEGEGASITYWAAFGFRHIGFGLTLDLDLTGGDPGFYVNLTLGPIVLTLDAYVPAGRFARFFKSRRLGSYLGHWGSTKTVDAGIVVIVDLAEMGLGGDLDVEMFPPVQVVRATWRLLWLSVMAHLEHRSPEGPCSCACELDLEGSVS